MKLEGRDTEEQAQAEAEQQELDAARRRIDARPEMSLKPWTNRPTLSGADYASEATWQEERDRIWFAQWIAVGRTEEVAKTGDYVVRDLAGESIFITRNKEGRLRAFYNVCSHRGTKFLDDDACGNAKAAFKCPYHAWTFDHDGKLLGTPNVRQEEGFDRSRFPLFSIHVDEHAGFIFVNLSEDPRPLLEQLGEGNETMLDFERYRMADLRIGAQIVYDVAANWKIIVENFNECLHCPSVHPELVQLVPLYRFGEVWEEDINPDGNPMAEGATSFNPEGKSTLPRLPELEDRDYRNYYGCYQFPNLLINFHPDIIMYYILVPKGPDRTVVTCQFLMRPETIADPACDPQPIVQFWDLVSRQDWEVCSRAQTGVGSRAFVTGVYPRQDRFLWAFNEQYRGVMGRPTPPPLA